MDIYLSSLKIMPRDIGKYSNTRCLCKSANCLNFAGRLSPVLPPIKLIKVGPIVSDGGLQVGRGEPGPGESLVPGMKCLSPLSPPSPSNNPPAPAPGNVCGDGDRRGKQNRKVLGHFRLNYVSHVNNTRARTTA